jgi:hypothetical protein
MFFLHQQQIRKQPLHVINLFLMMPNCHNLTIIFMRIFDCFQHMHRSQWVMTLLLLFQFLHHQHRLTAVCTLNLPCCNLGLYPMQTLNLLHHSLARTLASTPKRCTLMGKSRNLFFPRSHLTHYQFSKKEMDWRMKMKK